MNAGTIRKVLLTQQIHRAGMSLLEERFQVVTAPDPSHGTLMGLCRDVQAIVLRSASRIDREILEHAEALSIVSRTGAGVDNVDLEAATLRGILVCSLPGVNSLSVAEHAVALILALAKQTRLMDRAVREGRWEMRNAELPGEVEGKVLGLVGFGRIGSRVARICHRGLGMAVLVYDPLATEVPPEYTRVDSLAKLCREADFVSIHCPRLPETVRMIGAQLLGAMKRTACLINTARGEVVDEEALVEALRSRLIAGAALDVFGTEPPRQDHPLLAMENVILSPHAAALTREVTARAAREAAQAILDFADGREPRHVHNAEGLRARR